MHVKNCSMINRQHHYGSSEKRRSSSLLPPLSYETFNAFFDAKKHTHTTNTYSYSQGWQYGTVRICVQRTLSRTVPAYRTSVQFLKRTVPVPLQKKRTVPFSKN